MLTSMTLKTTPPEDEGGALGREDALIAAVAASTAGWPARVDALRRHQPRRLEGIGREAVAWYFTLGGTTCAAGYRLLHAVVVFLLEMR